MERCISNKVIQDIEIFIPEKTERKNTIREALIEMFKKLFNK